MGFQHSDILSGSGEQGSGCQTADTGTYHYDTAHGVRIPSSKRRVRQAR